MKRETFTIRIDQLQPSQPFLSQARLDNILRNTAFLLRPVHVREINGRYFLNEGHERCFALYSTGRATIEAYVDNSDTDLEIWKRCVEITVDSGVANISDLSEKILAPAMFRQLWVQRKKDMKAQLKAANPFSSEAA